MTFAQAEAIVARTPKIPISSPQLIGYELQTHESGLSPTDPHNTLFLAKAIQDCEGAYGRRIDFKLAEAPNGTLTLWTLPPHETA